MGCQLRFRCDISKIYLNVAKAMHGSDAHLSASTRAYRVLERAIVTLDLAPSSLTTESALSARFDLGRTPLREAIQKLSWEGLIDVRPRAGLAIAPLNTGDWLKVVEARTGVEVVLARSAARFAAPAQSERLKEAAQSMYLAVVSSNVQDFLEADKAFDEALAAAADNPFAARLAAPLQTHSRRFWYRFRRDTGLAEAASRHVELIRAILDGDEDGAEAMALELMSLLRGHAVDAARP
jgi:DNA-binding GntR family transcriptional regulator